AMMAAEMAIIRLTHVADLPDPETLIRRLQSQPQPAAIAAPSAHGTPQTGPRMASASQVSSKGAVTLRGAATAVAVAPDAVGHLSTFDQVVALIREKRDMKLLVEVETSLRLVHYAPGRIEFQPAADAAPDLAARLSQRLQSWTGARWGVSVTGFGGAATIAETRDRDRLEAEADVARLPLVQAVLAAFPGAQIAEIRTPASRVAHAAADALPGVGDEWDPFEDN
ncbi:MAG: DNA polymerase III subunit gamma/tau, partial [Rhodobacterales bacterium]